MIENRRSILGISFDGLATSGIVNELLNVAAVLRKDAYRVLVDVGRDIRMRSSMDFESAYFPDWVELVNCLGPYPEGYSAGLVSEVHALVNKGTSVAEARVYDPLCQELAASLVKTFVAENVQLLIVENGTLPDNPLFTEALYLAIEEYGTQQKLGKYVLWRDHDLMWSAEPHRFGSYPYTGVKKPQISPHIHYAVLTEWMRKRMQAWAGSFPCHVLPNRFFSSTIKPAERSLRIAYDIPPDDYLVARCTRVVPQKSIERDLRVLDQVQLRLRELGSRRKVFLFVTGPTSEDAEEFARLRELEKTLSIAGQIVWANGLLPFVPFIDDSTLSPNRFSIRDLLAEADLSSFLTTYDYEGFGNPPGEAMAMGVPFISTTYELYYEVYGSRGAIAPLLPIDRSTAPDAPIPDSFLDWMLRTLTESDYRAQITKRNREICQRFFSLEALDRQLSDLFGDVGGAAE
jgi:glycosyltransferase involved in cell wall biosynthesis